MVTVLLGVFALQSSASSSEQAVCLDKNKEFADWWVIIKLPKDRRSDLPLIQEGLGFIYMDSNQMSANFSFDPNVSLNSTSTALWNTLQQVYSDYNNTDTKLARGFSNDEVPNGGPESDSRGHTKGAFGFGSQTGFWILHSSPHFPNFVELGFSFPKSSTIYGQSFLCLSLATQDLETVGHHFLFTYPQFYNVSIPAAFQQIAPSLEMAVNGERIKDKPFSNLATLKTVKNHVAFTAVAKAKQLIEDSYIIIANQVFHSNLLSESWRNGVNKLPSNCSEEYDILNIHSIFVNAVMSSSYNTKFFKGDIFRFGFTSTKDHSKWAVPGPMGYPTKACIGDLNRQLSQEFRAGGFVCFNDTPNISAAMKHLVHLTEACN